MVMYKIDSGRRDGCELPWPGWFAGLGNHQPIIICVVFPTGLLVNTSNWQGTARQGQTVFVWMFQGIFDKHGGSCFFSKEKRTMMAIKMDDQLTCQMCLDVKKWKWLLPNSPHGVKSPLLANPAFSIPNFTCTGLAPPTSAPFLEEMVSLSLVASEQAGLHFKWFQDNKQTYIQCAHTLHTSMLVTLPGMALEKPGAGGPWGTNITEVEIPARHS